MPAPRWEPRLPVNLYAAAAPQADDAHGEEHDLIIQHYGILRSDLVTVVDSLHLNRGPAWRLR